MVIKGFRVSTRVPGAGKGCELLIPREWFSYFRFKVTSQKSLKV